MQRILFVMSLALVGGCFSEEPGVSVGYSGSYGYAAPQMEYIGPGVQVIADYDYPVFYSDGYYWRNDGGVWYRSGFYNRGWGVSYNVPVGVRGINNPGYYSHYRGGNYNARVNGGYNGGYRPNGNWGRGNVNAGGGVQVNDHRSGPVYRGGGGGGATYRPAPSRPVVRDHRR